MSNKEKCIAILDNFSERQLENIIVLLQATKESIDEAADDAYCEFLYRQYESDPDKNNTISLEDAIKQLGVSL